MLSSRVVPSQTQDQTYTPALIYIIYTQINTFSVAMLPVLAKSYSSYSLNSLKEEKKLNIKKFKSEYMGTFRLEDLRVKHEQRMEFLNLDTA